MFTGRLSGLSDAMTPEQAAVQGLITTEQMLGIRALPADLQAGALQDTIGRTIVAQAQAAQAAAAAAGAPPAVPAAVITQAHAEYQAAVKSGTPISAAQAILKRKVGVPTGIASMMGGLFSGSFMPMILMLGAGGLILVFALAPKRRSNPRRRGF